MQLFKQNSENNKRTDALNKAIGPGSMDIGTNSLAIEQAIKETKERAKKAEEQAKLIR